jgi:hypothetical protein
VTSLSWIPTEAVIGASRAAFDSGITHYDAPPPDVIEDIEALRADDRFRFANILEAWIDVDDNGKITGHGIVGGGMMGSTTVKLGALSHCFAAVGLPDLRPEPEVSATSVRFVQTTGGRTGIPAPRTVRRRPFIQWQAPLVWTTLALTINADGTSKGELVGSSRFPRHWVYDNDGALSAKSGLTDFKDWYGKSFGKHTPWGDQDSEALVTAVETALERTLSTQMMQGDTKPIIKKVKEGDALVRQGDEGTDVFLILDGVLRAERDGERLAEYGPGAVLGEHSSLRGGGRTATLVAVTACRVAAITVDTLATDDLQQLSHGHRHEDSR